MNEFSRLDATLIRSLLTHLAAEIRPTDATTLTIVGGAYLALLGLRESTIDIDFITPLSADLRETIAELGERHGLPHNSLNDHARAFAPRATDHRDVTVIFEAPQLKVVGLPLTEIFLMKLARASAADIGDMRILWPLVAEFFGSSRVVVDEFYRAFPLEPFDEYLEDFVASIITEAGKK